MITEQKAKKFAKELVANGFNATKALENTEDTSKLVDNTKYIKAHRLYKNVKVEKALRDIMAESDSGLTNDDLNRILKRNAQQEKNLAASNTAAELALKVKGELAPERKEIVNLQVTAENVNEMLQTLLEQAQVIHRLEQPKNTGQSSAGT